MVVDQGLLNGVEGPVPAAQILHRNELTPVEHGDEHDATVGCSIPDLVLPQGPDDDSAGAAVAFGATLLGPRKAIDLTQEPEHRHSWIDVVEAADLAAMEETERVAHGDISLVPFATGFASTVPTAYSTTLWGYPLAPMTFDELNTLDKAGFIRVLGAVFEDSPWVAAGAFENCPFADLSALHAGMVEIVRRADDDKQLSLLRAHPDLAGKAARAGTLTVHSTAEQSGAGLDRLTDGEFERFHALNSAYVGKFGFPFILAVKGHDKTSILEAFERRLKNSAVDERRTALEQVARIAALRLEGMLEAA